MPPTLATFFTVLLLAVAALPGCGGDDDVGSPAGGRGTTTESISPDTSPDETRDRDADCDRDNEPDCDPAHDRDRDRDREEDRDRDRTD